MKKESVAVFPTNNRSTRVFSPFLLHPRRSSAKNNLAMPDDITTRPMLESLLNSQRELASKMEGISDILVALTRRSEELAGKQDEFAGSLEAFGAKQDALDGRIVSLTREVRDGLDDNNRKIEALNKRLLSFETWLSRIDDRLHDEISARTR